MPSPTGPDLSLAALRVLREVAELGSFTAAGRSLGYTQSAVSRQVAGLEASVGQPLFERRPDGVVMTRAGSRMVRLAGRVLEEVAMTQRELAGAQTARGPVRLGAFPSASAGVVPAAAAAVRRGHPEIDISLREGSTQALVRALRVGAIDLALLASSPPFRPFDGEEPPLALEVVSEDSLLVGVGAIDPLAGRRVVELGELEGRRWVASRSEAGETLLGVWPGLAGKPTIAFTTRDWLAKVRIVEAGLAITTIPPVLAAAMPASITLLRVRGGADERRRLVIARLPGAAPAPGAEAVAAALRDAIWAGRP